MEIDHSVGLSDILSKLENTQSPAFQLQGLPPLAQAYFTLSWVSQHQANVVILCPDEDKADDLATDLRTLQANLFSHVSHQLLRFPTWQPSVYNAVNPSLEIRLRRIRAIHLLNQRNQPFILISTPLALLQKTLPSSVLNQNTTTLKLHHAFATSDPNTREALVHHLTQSGYLRVDLVEDPGSFSFRGEILDIFSPDADQPFRIEFFDDLVEKIRPFDAQTQRTLKNDSSSFQEVTLPPAREVLINSQTLPFLRQSIKEYADHTEIPRKIRDPLLEDLQNGLIPSHADAFASFAYPTPSTLLDYLHAEDCLFWSDPAECLQTLEVSFEQQKQTQEESLEQKRILPPVENLFESSPDRIQKLRQQSLLNFHRLEFSDDSASSPEKTLHFKTLPVQMTAGLSNAVTLENTEKQLKTWLEEGYGVHIFCRSTGQSQRLQYLLSQRGMEVTVDSQKSSLGAILHVGELSESLHWEKERLILIKEQELFPHRESKELARSQRDPIAGMKKWKGLQSLSDLEVGDLVVHREHGIGTYRGLQRLHITDAQTDFLIIEYAAQDKLYVPVYRLEAVQKYHGTAESVSIDRLGSQRFEKMKKQVKDAAKKLAFDLLQLYAQRQLQQGDALTPVDMDEFREFEAKFPFAETPDQQRAIDDTLRDIGSGKLMDRLICGDVGFGKTEVAIRAAYLAASHGKQVAILVPTTVLCLQHEQNFKQRFKDYPIVVEAISRFKSSKEIKSVLTSVREGKVDILIGTHRLLSSDVTFKDLGLLVIDEEHRFGVGHKEKLRSIRLNSHVLTLTATPIPRTLHMALSGIRDVSIISTPPINRLPIRTFVSQFDLPLIQKTIEFELARDGQVFMIHNRVQSIDKIAKQIADRVPHARMSIAHGQMNERELEKIMLDFYHRKTNVLICTTIIESGLDIPSANTIIINRADTFGLAQLYQLRGRVGRSGVRAFSYLLVPATERLTEDAKKRLEVIQRFVELGSGFQIATHDLEIRGGGNLLGPEQSGHIAAVGFELFTELLQEAITEAKTGTPSSEPKSSAKEPEIKVPFPAYLDESFIPDVHQRLSFYRRLSSAESLEALDELTQELSDRYGALPEAAQNLLWILRIKNTLKKMQVDSLTAGPSRVGLQLNSLHSLNPQKVIQLVTSNPKKYQITPDSKLYITMSAYQLKELYFTLEQLLGELLQ